ncbi:ribonuclease H [Formosa sp. Hel3_A1_48]|jgi:ribonuclease HI|uniref:ribonuclease H1 domain-containing protein n=1 Tax=Formosa sp. Hel3_A1_48 TaxID=1336795 RepID=UPI00084E370C|nr:ribonuclease H family protein [Formosa sp. Hel3_A1_48]AOR26308.1 ribonuclease H [Formosa sp. Hel3_A1_48]MDC0949945.1 ribonuclease H family protein [Flavobacteriaceae bacterium]
MPKAKQKYYTVWKGHKTGVFETWPECQLQIKNFQGAQYKSFATKATAVKAFEGLYEDYIEKNKAKKGIPKRGDQIEGPNLNSISVDAASSGNPGVMEYRGVDTQTKALLFHKGPFQKATNNIGEFLALVHGLALLKNQESQVMLYTDSVTAMSWVRKKKCNTKLKRTKENQAVFVLIDRAEQWLQNNTFTTKVVKWDTKSWGEIPADFGRK